MPWSKGLALNYHVLPRAAISLPHVYGGFGHGSTWRQAGWGSPPRMPLLDRISIRPNKFKAQVIPIDRLNEQAGPWGVAVSGQG